MNTFLVLLRRMLLAPRLVWCESIDRFLAPRLVRARGVVVGRNPRYHGIPVICRDRGAAIVFGDEVVLRSRPLSNALYLSRPCVIAAVERGARICIGNKVGMSAATIVAASQVEIGDGTLIGAEAAIIDTDFHPLDPVRRDAHQTLGAVSRPICIGKRVFIGMRAIILKGVSIADGAVVGAGAVVTHDVTAGDIVAGNPARVVGSVLANPRSSLTFERGEG